MFNSDPQISFAASLKFKELGNIKIEDFLKITLQDRQVSEDFHETQIFLNQMSKFESDVLMHLLQLLHC